jgi:hypothetical protein
MTMSLEQILGLIAVVAFLAGLIVYRNRQDQRTQAKEGVARRDAAGSHDRR